MRNSLRTAAAKQAPKVKTNKREGASEVELSEVDKEKLALAKIFNAKPEAAWDGIHGVILICKGPALGGSVPRFAKDKLAKAIKSKHFRWIEGDKGGEITIGC
jgi:hypothetical protein